MALTSMLMQKSDDKTEASLSMKRSESGWAAWNALHRYYVAIMHPQQAKRAADMIFEAEKLRDELKECTAPGA